MQSTTTPKLSSPRFQRRLLWLSSLVLAAGVAAVIVVFTHNTTNSLAQQPSGALPKPAPAAKKTPLTKEERQVAGKFILTAVLRKNLAEAWKISGPQIRGGLTYKEFLKGDIPVVPYTYKLGNAPLSVQESTKDHALLLIALLSTSKNVKPYYFFMDLNKVGKGAAAHWIVTGWSPAYGGPGIPANPAQ